MLVNRNMKSKSRLLSDSYHMPGAFYSADKPHSLTGVLLSLLSLSLCIRAEL